MAIQGAMDFIKAAGRDRALRKSLYKIEKNDIIDHLTTVGYKFTIPEFEESINLLHVQCQSEEQASKLFEVVWWFKMLFR